MKLRFSLSFLRSFQKLLQILVTITAVMGGLGLIITDGLGMDPSILKPTPFDSFLIPGVILAGVVGGTHAYALYSSVKKLQHAQFAGAVAGFGLIIWLFVEVYWLLHTSPLQLVYFVIGILQLMIVFGLLNIAPWLIKNHRQTSA